MQGLITLDFGNSHPHAGIFHKNLGNWELIRVVPFSELSLYLNQLQMNSSNTSMVLSEVKSREEELRPYIDQGYLLTRIKEYWKGSRFAGMPVHYAKTLGEDRLIEAFYCFKKYRPTPLLIIDAGTYVTMDVITSDGLQGGYIIPGISNYFQTYSQGEQLKDVILKTKPEMNLPQETADAMGMSYQAFAHLSKQLVEKYQLKKIILTGGDANIWKEFFNAFQLPVELEVAPHLIHSALHYWMTTQIEPL